jgi:hypothetical protein
MDNPLCNQRQLEMEESMRMTPAARLDWLAAAWEFTQEIERSRAASRKKKP